MVVVCAVVAGWLVLREIEAYRSPGWVSSLTVDTRPIAAQHHIELALDVTLPGMRCGDFGLDLADVTGELQLNAGRLAREPYTGAGSAPRGGCRAHGRFVLHRVDGEFHVAFGRVASAPRAAPAPALSATQAEALGHRHHFTPRELWRFNATHTVNRLAFGDAQHPLCDRPHPACAPQPLDGVGDAVPRGADSARFWYLVRIVPVRRMRRGGGAVADETYEYTFLRHVEPVTYGPTFRQPGLFFKYTISPYVVVRTPIAPSLHHTVASCLAILGGMRALCILLQNVFAAVLRNHGSVKSFDAPRATSSRIGDPAPVLDTCLYP